MEFSTYKKKLKSKNVPDICGLIRFNISLNPGVYRQLLFCWWADIFEHIYSYSYDTKLCIYTVNIIILLLMNLKFRQQKLGFLCFVSPISYDSIYVFVKISQALVPSVRPPCICTSGLSLDLMLAWTLNLECKIFIYIGIDGDMKLTSSSLFSLKLKITYNNCARCHKINIHA